MTFDTLANKVSDELPVGYEIVIRLENGYGFAALYEQESGECVFVPSEDNESIEFDVTECIAFAKDLTK